MSIRSSPFIRGVGCGNTQFGDLSLSENAGGFLREVDFDDAMVHGEAPRHTSYRSFSFVGCT